VAALASDALAGRAPGSDGAEKARALIRAALEGCGYRVTEQDIDGPGVNLLAERPGAETADRRVLLSAHYDHLGVVAGQVMNGADDNAAAVGAVVEAACRTPYAADAPASLLVALWDTEEPPYFLTQEMGSAAFVAAPPLPLARIDVAIVLDLVGGGLWEGSPFHVALGAETSPAVEAALAATPAPAGLTVLDAGLHLVEHLVATGRHQPWSDYHAFRLAEVPVLFLSNGQSHHYHRPSDDFDTLRLDALALQTDWLTALVTRLLAAPEKPAFSPTRVRPAADLAATRALVEGALAHARSGAADAGNFDTEVLAATVQTLDPTRPETLRRAVQRVQCFGARRFPLHVCGSF
jgi:Zn-dependent M28 family amino/carboxypeptidase